MYKRKIESVLLKWKETPNHKPLVIKGVRQCGKTSSVLDFTRKHFKNVIYIDFHKQEALKELFNGSLDTDYLTVLMSASIPGSRFVPGKTCIVLDEIQDCPRARASLKFFNLDGRYDIICTGSLLGVNGYKTDEDATIPVGFEILLSGKNQNSIKYCPGAQ